MPDIVIAVITHDDRPIAQIIISIKRHAVGLYDGIPY